MAKVGAVIYEYYKNAFDGRCEKYTFKACEFDSRQAMRSYNLKKQSKSAIVDEVKSNADKINKKKRLAYHCKTLLN